METQKLIPHLFRTEYRKIVAVLCRQFGFEQMEAAEDVASDTFFAATQTWSYKGVPSNPAAWLYRVAANKAHNYLQRQRTFNKITAANFASAVATSAEPAVDLSEQNIYDSQLQMMFTICHPALPAEAQIALALRILCSFSVEEIADAFLTGKETINKRLYRAKEKIRSEHLSIEMPRTAQIEKRLSNVLLTIYLLFNEGYYSANHSGILRKDFCLEAMRLCHMLIENKSTNQPQVNALLALMCFHSSRFEARINRQGEHILYNDQDSRCWNQELIAKGTYYFKQAAAGHAISKYHIEAGIAYWSTFQEDSREKWEHVLQLYNRLLQIEYSPVAALNRTYALFKANGVTEAIIEAEKLKLTDNRFYFVLLGKLYTSISYDKAHNCYEKALSLSKAQVDINLIQGYINNLHLNQP